MTALKCIALLVTVAVAYGFTCPPEGIFYHADAKTGGHVYHYCEDSEMTTFTCPTGKIFDYRIVECADASVTHSAETKHYIHKHSADDKAEHSIPIDVLKEGLEILHETVKDAIKEILKEEAPTIHERIEDEYAELVRSVKEDILPVFKEKVMPKLNKAIDYSKYMGEKIVQKVYQSWELSNSTHINVVSFSDVVEELSDDIKPFVELGRYLSSRLVPGKASVKRQAVPEMLLGFMEPVAKGLIQTIGGMFTGQDNTLTSKLFVPILMEMVQDPETMFDLQKIFWSSKAAFSPLVYDMLKMQNYRSPDGTVIRIPQASINAARDRFYPETKPILRKVMEKHLPMILRRSSENVPLILQALDLLKESSGTHVGVLQDSITRFISKHGALFTTSGDNYVNSYTLSEIKRDLKPIEITLLQIMIDYLAKSPNSWMSSLFNRGSILFKALLGPDEGSAKPSPNFYRGAQPSNTRVVGRGTRPYWRG